MSNNEENTISVEEMADMLEQLGDCGVREVDPKQRSLNVIGQRHNIVQQDIPATNTTIPDITDIPEGITVNSTPNTKQNECNDDTNLSSSIPRYDKNKMNCAMIIDVLNEKVLNSMETMNTCPETTCIELNTNLNDI